MKKDRKLIEAFERLKHALKTCNEQELNILISEDYKGFSLNGTVESKADVLLNFKPGGVELTKYEVTALTYDVYSEIGIVSGKGFIAGNYQEYKFQHNVLFLDIFKYVDSEWIYFKSQVTEIPSE